MKGLGTKMKTLRVATHNICHMGFNPLDGTQAFQNGKYRFGYEADAVEMMRRNWKEVYSSFSADLIGLQEYYYWFDQAHEIITEQEIFVPAGYQLEDDDMGLALASKYAAQKVYALSFEPVSKRRRQKFYVDVDGRRIAVFNSHPTPKDNREIRKKEYELLIEEYKREECFVAFGDYNAQTADEFEIFSKAGFPMANTGLGTVIRTGATCDNIIVSPNIRIEAVKLYDEKFTLSDHKILYAEITLL